MSVVSYLKVIPVKFDVVNYPADTSHQLIRTYSDNVTSANSVTVSLNGQKIPLHTAESASTFAKYYFEIVSIAPSGITIKFVANTAYTNPGYSSGPAETGFLPSDVLFLEYSYLVTI